MAFASHIVTVRRLKKYIDDVIGKKANLPDTSKTIIGNISQINTDLTELDLLWTNPNGGADFPAQTVTIANLSKYDFIVFDTQWSSNGSNAPYVSTTISPYVNGKKTILGGFSTKTYRVVTFSGNNLQFDKGSSSSGSEQIPLKVWGMHKHN